ncbi:metal-binding protein [Pedobacter yulinensis]|uniref:Metal-binding protein n=1 Tax=Pedobacter yulinensis TaxID=2126353 RepID=A0A2T3HQR5_9SPHI|nr:Ada metal-binding domain-containing protein [Pedobacter yulinensis]PST84788.1 metal-binding protein [Pedobacter yulinensis]
MKAHHNLSDAEVRAGIHNGQIRFAGNARLRIYGTLHCISGKRMLRRNRMFFVSLQEAAAAGYRPCAHCLRVAYLKWKNGTV